MVCLSPFGLLQQNTTDRVTSGHFFTSHRLEAGRRDQGASMVVRGPFLAIDFPLCAHLLEGARDLSGVSFVRARTPFLGVPLS